MDTVTKSIDVDVPVRAAYDQWTQFETFPQFMQGVKEVRQLDATHLHWVVEIGGNTEEWDAEITEQIPDKRIAWTAVAGHYNSGVVTFHYLDDNKSRVTLQLGYETDGALQKLGDVLGVVSRQVEGDLENFKQFIEERGGPTGSWRGRIEHGQVVEQPLSSS
jgi:uncharacterized membrane protein